MVILKIRGPETLAPAGGCMSGKGVHHMKLLKRGRPYSRENLIISRACYVRGKPLKFSNWNGMDGYDSYLMNKVSPGSKFIDFSFRDLMNIQT